MFHRLKLSINSPGLFFFFATQSMEYDFPAFHYSSAFGDVQMFPLWEEMHTCRKHKQQCWLGTCLPLPELPNTSKWRWQLSVFCWLFECISHCQWCCLLPCEQAEGLQEGREGRAIRGAVHPAGTNQLEIPMLGFAHHTLGVAFSI